MEDIRMVAFMAMNDLPMENACVISLDGSTVVEDRAMIPPAVYDVVDLTEEWEGWNPDMLVDVDGMEEEKVVGDECVVCREEFWDCELWECRRCKALTCDGCYDQCVLIGGDGAQVNDVGDVEYVFKCPHCRYEHETGIPYEVMEEDVVDLTVWEG